MHINLFFKNILMLDIKAKLLRQLLAKCLQVMTLLAIHFPLNGTCIASTIFTGTLEVADPTADFHFSGNRYDQYTFTAPSTGVYEFRTAPPGFDTVFYLFLNSFVTGGVYVCREIKFK